MHDLRTLHTEVGARIPQPLRSNTTFTEVTVSRWEMPEWELRKSALVKYTKGFRWAQIKKWVP
jgi:hypothetical protein